MMCICFRFWRSRRQPFNHRQNPVGALLQIRVNLGQFTRRLEDVEMPVERDFIANPGFVVVDPGIRRMGQHFALEVDFHILMQRHVFSVAQTAVGLRFAFLFAFGG